MIKWPDYPQWVDVKGAALYFFWEAKVRAGTAAAKLLSLLTKNDEGMAEIRAMQEYKDEEKTSAWLWLVDRVKSRMPMAKQAEIDQLVHDQAVSYHSLHGKYA